LNSDFYLINQTNKRFIVEGPARGCLAVAHFLEA